MGITKPAEPKTQQITYTIQSGEQLQVIAERHHTTVASIMQLNGIKNADKISAGAKIKIDAVPDEEYKRYQDLKAKYDAQVYEQRKKQEIADRTALAEIRIEQAKNNGWEEDYSFSIDKEGFIQVKLKGNKKLAEIREDFNLPPGSLDVMNDFETRYGEIPTAHDGTRDVKTWDNHVANEGETFRLDTDRVSTERTWTQAFKDWLPF